MSHPPCASLSAAVCAVFRCFGLRPKRAARWSAHLLLGLLCVGICGGTTAAEHASRDEAQAMAEAAAAHVRQVGPQQAFQDFGADPAWRRKDLYVFVLDFNGRCLAHGVNRKMVGRNLAELLDESGRSPVLQMVALARSPGSGWVRYEWTDPVKHALETKTSYIRRIDGVSGLDALVGVGVYSDWF